MVLPTCTMEWHDVQPSPACASGGVDLVHDRPVEAPVEEHRVVVAAGAPLRRPGAHHLLHVLDGPPVPLVVERREVVGRGVPLLVDVGVAPAAGLAGQEEVGGNGAAGVRRGRRRRERAGRPGSLLGHARGGADGVLSMRWVSRQSASRARAQQGARSARLRRPRRGRCARPAAHPRVPPGARHRWTPHRTAPATDTATWICSSGAWSRVAPAAATASPRTSPAASRPTPAGATTFPRHGRRHAARTSVPTSTRPSRGCRPTVVKYARDAAGAATRWAAVSSRAMKPSAASREVLVICHPAAGRRDRTPPVLTGSSSLHPVSTSRRAAKPSAASREALVISSSRAGPRKPNAAGPDGLVISSSRTGR